MSSIQRLSHPGGVDADGHILEPPDLWELYIESRYHDRALRLRVAEDGLEYLEINGAPSKVVRRGLLGMVGSMGRAPREVAPSPEHTYVRGGSFGAMNAGERLERLDQERLEQAFLYPTLSLFWEAECTGDAEIAQAYTRAYNRWIVDFCADSGGRLVPIAHLSLGDPAVELERAVRSGARGAWVAMFTMTKKPHGHPDHDRLFAAAQDLDVPLAIHPSFEPKWALPGRFDAESLHGAQFFLNVTSADAVRHAFTSFFQFGVFDRFPRLKLVVLESGAGWIGYWLDRMDGYRSSTVGRSIPLKEKPSFYFNRQCWISCDPDERTVPALMELYGEDRFFWASDFPHPDHTGDYITELDELAARLPESARKKLLGENVRKAYGLQA